MLRGCGASGAASLGPSSLAAAASAALSAAGLRHVESIWSRYCGRFGDRTLASAAREEPAAQPAPAKHIGAAQATPATASTSDDQDDSSHLPLQFSLRPSVLSPLYPMWDKSRQMAQRREHLVALLKSHTLLSSSFRAKDDPGLARKVRQRVEQIQQVASQLRQLLDERTLTAALATCPSPAHGAAFCAALEESTLRTDPAARDFARVQRGEASAWDHYAQYFHDRYQNTPRLQPLEVIFSKPDPAELVRQLRLPASTDAVGAGASAARPRGSIGPHIDVAGVTHAAGKRKSSTATLDLVPGSGRMTVNGLPVASYFRDLGVRQHALQALMIAGSESKYDIAVRVRGGGPSGQAQAVRTAVARALCVQQPSLAGPLAEYTRWDGRVVERKKPGREKARRGYTWVKR